MLGKQSILNNKTPCLGRKEVFMFKNFLKENFSIEVLKQPIFNSFENSMRILLRNGNKEELEESTKLAIKIFMEAFNENDDLFVGTYLDVWDEETRIKLANANKIFSKYLFEQNDTSQIYMREIIERYEMDESVQTFELFLGTKTKNVNFKKLLCEKFEYYYGKTDFEIGELYFVNVSENLILHPYDDRGIDIIFKDKESLKHYVKVFDDFEYLLK